MGLRQVMPVMGQLAAQAEALAVVAGAVGRPWGDQPALVREVLARLGLDGEGIALAPGEAELVAGLARAVLLQAVELAEAPARPAGWGHADPRILQGQGAASATLVPVLRDVVAPRLDGLAARLAGPGAAFLDIGVGVAALSIAMCGTWTRLRVVGVDPFAPALELARANIARAGLADRIELRQIGAEDLTGTGSFDLAWFALPFIPDAALDRAAATVTRSLRPGGWFLTATFGGPGELGMALARLRTARAGGRLLDSAGTESLLAAHGLVEIVTFPPATWGPGILTAGRKPLPGQP